MTFSPFLVANARHVARDDADRGPLALRSARLALWGFLWVDAPGSERTLATRRDLAASLRRLGATCWEIAGQERKRMERFCRPLPYHLATAPGYTGLELTWSRAAGEPSDCAASRSGRRGRYGKNVEWMEKVSDEQYRR